MQKTKKKKDKNVIAAAFKAIGRWNRGFEFSLGAWMDVCVAIGRSPSKQSN